MAKLKFDTGYGSIWVYDPGNCLTYHVCIDETVAIIGPLTPAEAAHEALNAMEMEDEDERTEDCGAC